MVLHLPFERCLEDGREDTFDDILDFLCVLGLVGFHDLLGDIVCGSGDHFAFCHVGINPPMGCPEWARTVSTNLAFTQTIIHSRGSNENTNGLLREYFPKGQDITDIPDAYIQEMFDKLRKR